MNNVNIESYNPRGGRIVREDNTVVNEADLMVQLVESSGGSNKNNIAVYLDLNGDGTGAFNAIGDYSASPTDFFIQPVEGQIIEIERAIITIEDSGSIDSGGYGNNSNPLTNGIVVLTEKQGGADNILTAQVPIRRTADWNSLCFDGQVADFGAGNSFYVARWTFSRDGDPIKLTENDKLIFRLNDNFASQGLIGHRFLVKGKIIQEGI